MAEREGEAAERDALRTPDEWCRLLDAHVLDPDGWRDGTRAWHEPINRDEFDRRLNRCTVDGRGYPMFLGLGTSPVKCSHENVKTFRSLPPHSKCLDCGARVEQRWTTASTTDADS